MKKFQWLFTLLLFHIALVNCKYESHANPPQNDMMLPVTEKMPVDRACSGINPVHLAGKFNPAEDSSFAVIPARFTPKKRIFLRDEALEAFKFMWKAAQAEGVKLTILSAARNWTYQRGIWNRKWNGSRYAEFDGQERAVEILKYSSMPGSSRHHWGTDVDLNNFENEWFESDPIGIATYLWLTQHAAEFGFYQVYGDQTNGRTGYREEKWHWSYLPLAEPLLACYLSNPPVDAFENFDGSNWADSIGIVGAYVGGVDSPLP